MCFFYGRDFQLAACEHYLIGPLCFLRTADKINSDNARKKSPEVRNFHKLGLDNSGHFLHPQRLHIGHMRLFSSQKHGDKTEITVCWFAHTYLRVYVLQWNISKTTSKIDFQKHLCNIFWDFSTNIQYINICKIKNPL